LTSGGPGTSTQILITYSYVSAFDYYNYGIAAAYAVISIIILVIFVVVVNKMTKMMSVLY
ncbi:MAG: sugar ABC transporter permease, partial [Candidatus Thermoplasmatota archaeon]|nr:sugar ABC transporter permease [Candidatus Thermoplasmatota archaeon]